MKTKRPELIDAIAGMKFRKLSDAPRWRSASDDTRDGWYWCEDLADDSPPQLLRSYLAMKTNRNGSLSVATESPRHWQRWTVAGWVPLVGRIAPCTGRPGE